MIIFLPLMIFPTATDLLADYNAIYTHLMEKSSKKTLIIC